MDHLEQVAGFDMQMDRRIAFGEVSVRAMIEQYKPMFMRHWNEVALYKDERPLDPDWDAYIRLAKAGKIVCYAASDGQEVVAYSVYAISHSLHYRTWTSATNDVYYVDPSMRRTPERWLALDFFRAADQWLKDNFAVRSIRYPVKAHLDNSAVFKELGYSCVEHVLEKLV